MSLSPDINNSLRDRLADMKRLASDQKLQLREQMHVDAINSYCLANRYYGLMYLTCMENGR